MCKQRKGKQQIVMYLQFSNTEIITSYYKNLMRATAVHVLMTKVATTVKKLNLLSLTRAFHWPS